MRRPTVRVVLDIYVEGVDGHAYEELALRIVEEALCDAMILQTESGGFYPAARLKRDGNDLDTADVRWVGWKAGKATRLFPGAR